MKKLISAALAVTMLVTPLVGSACFADEVNKQNVQYIQNKNRSEKFKFKKDEYPKIKKFLAGVAAGTIALTGITVATLKKFEDKLPESLKSKFPFLFSKETQSDNESEKALETFKEGEDDETFTEESNIAKDETVESAGVENGNGFIHDEIIRPLTPNNIKPARVDNIINNIADANNTSWLSILKNPITKAKWTIYSIFGILGILSAKALQRMPQGTIGADVAATGIILSLAETALAVLVADPISASALVALAGPLAGAVGAGAGAAATEEEVLIGSITGTLIGTAAAKLAGAGATGVVVGTIAGTTGAAVSGAVAIATGAAVSGEEVVRGSIVGPIAGALIGTAATKLAGVVTKISNWL